MSEEILINVTPQETRVAVVENGVLQEVYIERARHRGIVGNIYKGKVVRILPGMQAAFVDIGLERTAFLHVSDIHTPKGDVQEAQALSGDANTAVSRAQGCAGATDVQGRTSVMCRDAQMPRAQDAQERPPGATDVQEAQVSRAQGRAGATDGAGGNHQRIHDHLHDGQEIVVQVVKDPLGNKGARLTTHITFPARYLVYMPYTSHIGISQKIGDDATRHRLRGLIRAAMEEGDEGGYILRTLAETATEEELKNDIRYLRRVWSACQERVKTAISGTLIHEDLALAIRAMRDLVREKIEKIRIDSRETFTKACEFAHEFIPEVEDHIEYYPGERPIFDLYSVEDEIQKSLERKVPLKSGGHLIFDQTEAMTTIDVNTGTYVGKKNLEETIFKTNLEAAQAIARQLRLRNLGGMIIIDFIDMAVAEHRRQVLRALEKALARDHTKAYMVEMSSLGLVELTRKRTRESLERVLCAPCPVCEGRGMLKTPQTVCYEIFREILREARQFGADEYLVLASQVVIDLLLDEEAPSLMGLQEFIGKSIQLKVEPFYSQEQYDVVLM